MAYLEVERQESLHKRLSFSIRPPRSQISFALKKYQPYFKKTIVVCTETETENFPEFRLIYPLDTCRASPKLLICAVFELEGYCPINVCVSLNFSWKKKQKVWRGHFRDRGWFSTFHVGASKRKRGVFLGTFLLVFKVSVNEGRRSIIRARTNFILVRSAHKRTYWH